VYLASPSIRNFRLLRAAAAAAIVTGRVGSHDRRDAFRVARVSGGEEMRFAGLHGLVPDKYVP
jgi:hypothetical protein